MSTTIYIRACTIVDRIIGDIFEIPGLENAWEHIDRDTKDAIRSTWIDIAIKEIAK